MPKKPVVFLAFANDRVDHTAYLRNLPREMEGIRNALERARQAGLCEVIERSNVTVDQIINVFQSAEFKDRIAIFHYGGHANGYQLLLETLEGEHSSAHSEGLVSFFSRQLGLKLIFLNGCSSQQQAIDLIQSGIPSVIGTSQAINDDVATQLAIRFYKGLGEGHAIEKAWAEAVDEVKIQKGTANTRDLYWEGEIDTIAPSDRFPWEIHFREGSEIIRNWNMPEAVDNPLFGLPAVPPTYHLPESPYLYLHRYERPQAEIFFGRSYYIRTLYNLVVNPKSPPLILLYGQSGVGKSSLIDAGFKPRLEYTHHIWYLRRDQGISIPTLFEKAAALKEGVLNKMASELSTAKVTSQDVDEETEHLNSFYRNLERLSVDYNEGLPEEMRELFYRLTIEVRASKDFYLLKKRKVAKNNKVKSIDLIDNTEMSLLDQWLHLEELTGKPLVIIVDQLESVFTTPDPNLVNEFEEFVTDIQNLFGNPERLPKGKLILSYRKEYHPEIEDRFKEVQMPRSRVFLKHLGRKDIEDVVTGLTKLERTRQQYQLQVEPNLPTIIADDLLEDKESPIAPVLQILLTKLWQLTVEDDGGVRKFTIDKYQQLRQDGILMDDFYIQQMAVLKAWNPEVVKSGLALDVMMFHSSSLMTADIRRKEELYHEYAENLDVLEPLIEKLMELYLLSGIQVDNERRTTLAHDTLAPIVFQQYRSSDYPGQRARRILENKVSSYNPEDPSTGLDLADLEIVEYGHYGMRAWTEQEFELVEESRKRRKRHFKAQERRRRLAVAATILIAFLGVLAGIEAWRARTQKKLAMKNAIEAHEAELKAQDEARLAHIAEEEAKKQTKIADAQREKALVAQRKAQEEATKAFLAEQKAEQEAARAKTAEAKAQKNLILAQKQEASAKANAALAMLQQAEAERQKASAIRNQQRADSLSNLAQAKALALKAANVTNVTHKGEISGILALQAYKDIQQFRGNTQDKDVYHALANAWSEMTDTPNVIDAKQGDIEQLLIAQDKQYLVSSGTNGSIKFWSIKGEVFTPIRTLSFCQTDNCYTRHIDISPNDEYVVSYHTDNQVRFWDLGKDHKDDKGVTNYVIKKNAVLKEHGEKLIGGAFYSNTSFVSVDFGGNIMFWKVDPETRKPENVQNIKSDARITTMIKHPTKPVLLMVTINNEIKLLDLESKTIKDWLSGQLVFNTIRSMAFSADGELLALGTQKGDITTIMYQDEGYNNSISPWDYYLKTWQAHLSAVTDLSFDDSNTRLASSSYDQTVKVYNVADIKKSKKEPRPIIDIQEGFWVKSVFFMPKGREVVFGGVSSYIYVANTDLKDLADNVRTALRESLASPETRESVRIDLVNTLKDRDDYDKIIEGVLEAPKN